MPRAPHIALLVLLSAINLPAHAEGLADHVRRVDPPQAMPPLVFEDADHIQHALSDYRGRFVLLNIWATWCAPCVSEMPSLDHLQKNTGGKLAVLALSEDRGDATVSAFYHTHGIAHLPVAIDKGGRAPTTLHLRGLPTTLLIDPQGREIARVEGDEKWDSPEAMEFLKDQMR